MCETKQASVARMVMERMLYKYTDRWCCSVLVGLTDQRSSFEALSLAEMSEEERFFLVNYLPFQNRH